MQLKLYLQTQLQPVILMRWCYSDSGDESDGPLFVEDNSNEEEEEEDLNFPN